MNTPLEALSEMQRLTSPFPESVTVKECPDFDSRIVWPDTEAEPSVVQFHT